jgi:glyoxylase-like metal-dependent hydrolase (beta-lactamase superfamily II)
LEDAHLDFGKFKLHIIRECHFRLDGGAMFGVVPKTLWNKVSPADEANRVLMSCNLLLIETPTANVLVETGMGPRWSAKERERYGLETLIDHEKALASIGMTNDAVDAVIISHMHFDHIGGAVIEKNGKLVPTFPNARYYVQKGEYELAHNANGRARGSYRAGDYETLEQRGVLQCIDGDTEIVPGVFARVTGGHTSHHQVVVFESAGRTGVYFADIIPTSSHLSPPWVMGYDHFPLHTCDIKDEWLSRAAVENWLVVFDHEKAVPWGNVTRSTDGKFAWQPLPEHTLGPDKTPAHC